MPVKFGFNYIGQDFNTTDLSDWRLVLVLSEIRAAEKHDAPFNRARVRSPVLREFMKFRRSQLNTMRALLVA